MAAEFSARLVRAFEMAWDLHQNQFRKGSSLPYITHLMGTASIVGDYGGDEDQEAEDASDSAFAALVAMG